MWFEVLPPLREPAPGSGHASRVADLLHQYAAILERRWDDHPASIDAAAIRNFLRLPEWEGAPSPR